MNSSITMYITLICLSGIFNSFLAYYVYVRRKEITGSRAFILYTIALSLYSYSYAIEIATDQLIIYKVFNYIEWLAMPMSVPLGVVVIYNYLGKRFSRRALVALFSMPIMTWFIYLTNDYHRLFFKVYRFKEEISIFSLEMVVGEWYIIFNVYVFCCWLASLLLLIGRWRQTRNSFRLQLFSLICGQLTPMITGLLFLLGITPAGLDPVPLGLCVTSGIYIWVIMSTRMLTIIPIAKETIFDSMGEGVIVLDFAERLIDFNSAAIQMIPRLHPMMVGKEMDEVWYELTGEASPLLHIPKDGVGELSWTINGVEQHYQLKINSLNNKNGDIVGSMLMFINVSELKRLQKELEYQAYYDGLTQILNRTQFISICRNMLLQSEMENKPFTIILFDIDYFKNVNDSYGHEVGDRLLVHVVAICKKFLNTNMLFARYGGEEFVIGLPSYSIQEGHSLAEKIRVGMELTPLLYEKDMIHVTSSFGVSQTTSNADNTLNSILREADEALYVSKRSGRNCVTSYNKSTI